MGGPTTPLYPLPTIVVLLKVAPEETRKNLMVKSCQTSEHGTSNIPYRYIENLTNAYAVSDAWACGQQPHHSLLPFIGCSDIPSLRARARVCALCPLFARISHGCPIAGVR